MKEHFTAFNVLPAPSGLVAVGVLFSLSETKRNAKGFVNFCLEDQCFSALWKDGVIILLPKKLQNGLVGRSLVHRQNIAHLHRFQSGFRGVTVYLVILGLASLF
jgi:hypothetical protein